MTPEQLIEAIEGAGYSARSYSGRGMNGKECVGIDTASGVSEWKLVLQLAEELQYEADDPEYAIAELEELTVRSDSMGKGMIFYFPEMSWPDE